MKRLLQSAIGVLLFGLVVIPAHAGFKSLYVFGDALSATADATAPQNQYFYGQRWSNGRVWVEVLAQRQGLTYNAANNNSYWNHTSAQVVTDVKNFTAPAGVANSLFIVWVCNADTFDAATAPAPLTATQWQATNNLSQANHLQIITNLYAKGVRYLILPNAVDLSEIPAFSAGTFAPAIHAGCVDYNARFATTIAQAQALCPGLTIYTPDFFTLLNNVLKNPANYGLTNALSPKGFSMDAYDDAALPTLNTNGPGTNFIFWDRQDPTAEFHEVIADVALQIISPVQIGQITALVGTNQLDIVNLPVGLNGYVDATTNLTSPWSALQQISSSSPALSILVPTPAANTVVSADSGGFGLPPGGTPVLTAVQFYRLHFPYAWSWP
jgi:phospholipase/lecithinase/hemolysin